MKILLVEDSATLRFAMRNYIIEAGHTPLVAQSGEEALQLLEKTPVDMIIMDVEMPGLNGFETTRLIREWLGGYWIPIVFVTGCSDDESYREGIEAGGDDYIIKPVSAMFIKAKIQAMQRISDMRDQLKQLNAELEALSQLDSLTQIYNRRTFNDMALQQWLHATRNKTAVSVLMIDVDHFKMYNDRYGHPAGDACLKRITHALRDSLNRPYDLLGRYGGEEFIVLLPETNTLGAMQVAKTIQKSVSHLGLRHETSPTSSSVTVSIGGASCTHTGDHTLEELIKHADRALYKAKYSGRNRALVDDIALDKTILVIEQNTDAAQAMTQTLIPHFNILLSKNVEEALHICLDISLDAILIDAVLADDDDKRICRLLARNPKTNAIPILVMSEKGSTPRPASDATVGIRGSLSKPLNAGALMQKMQQLIS